jgi:hypothetical protein
MLQNSPKYIPMHMVNRFFTKVLRQFSGERLLLLSQMVLEKLDMHMQKHTLLLELSDGVQVQSPARPRNIR